MDAHQGLTADDVHHAAFSKPPFGERGYNEDDVDDFLERLENRLANPAVREPTALEVAAKSFAKPPIGKRGYNESEVDELMRRAVATLERTDGTLPPRSTPWAAPTAEPYEAPPLDEPARKKWRQLW